ncbi:MAG: FAD-binding oxidoreductase, partial [Gammaproteobacteria bacterium]|nr:FAD-binding oxidoreductase [Gammaproteobacteria bacterium]
AAEDFVHAGYPREAEAILLCEVDGTSAEVEASVALVTRIFNELGAFAVRLATEPEEQANLWRGRKAAFPAMGRLAPDYYCMDGTIPRSQLARVLKEIKKMSEHYGLAVANVFHAGDGNLHPLILYDASRAGEQATAEEMGGKILELCVAVGGTITGEHGVGVEKLDQMCVQFSHAELAQFLRVKACFDPNEMLNPGKAIPTLARCSEVGGMHVHGGRLPFPNLERF